MINFLQFFLSLWGFIQFEAYQLENEYFVLFTTDKETVNFSSYRLTSPDRIVLEIADETLDGNSILTSMPVKSIKVEQKKDKLRIIFLINPGSSYNILNKEKMLLIGFKNELYIDDFSFDDSLAFIQEKGSILLPQKEIPAETVEPKTAIAENIPAPTKNDQKAEQKEAVAEKSPELAATEKVEKKELPPIEIAVVEKKPEPVKVAAALPKPEQKIAVVEKKAETAPIQKIEKKELPPVEIAVVEKKPEPVKVAAALPKPVQIAAVVEKSPEPAKIAVIEPKPEQKIAVAEKLTEQSREPVKVRVVKIDEESGVKNLKVVKIEKTKQISPDTPKLPVVKIAGKGRLNNLYFRKFEDFSRLTMEIKGNLEYRFREIDGGYVIDVFNLKKIPRYLLNIIDTRAFNAEIKYIYPQKKGQIFKIYIKTDQGTAVKKSESGNFINFDFFVPSLQ